MTVKFHAEVIQVNVKIKKENIDGEFVTRRIGRLTLEFDGEDVNVGDLAELVHGEDVYLGIDSSQRETVADMVGEFHASLKRDGTRATVSAGGESATFGDPADGE